MWGENISARGIPNRDLINTILMKKDDMYERLSKSEREQLEQLEKEHPYVDLLTDAGFKHVFGRPANKKILIDFLNAIISDRHIVDLTYINNEQIPTIKDSKHSRLDLYCTTDDGSRIIVELQRNPQKDYIYRSLYYSALSITEQVEVGSSTYKFCPVYNINILDFMLPEFSRVEDIDTCVTLIERKHNIKFGELLTMIYIELPKFTKRVEELDRENLLEKFYFCLRYIYELKNCPEPLQIIENLFIAAKVAAMDSQEKINYLREMNTERDRRNQMQYQYDMGLEEGMEVGFDKGVERGIKIGIAQGIEQGIEQEAMRMAAKLKSLGIEMNIILESTGLTREQIEKL